VSLAIKNFDMVFIYRDYTNWKRISSIPIEQLDSIKDWLNESEVLYSEGPMSLVWPTVLAAVRSDIGAFLADGGWKFLQVDSGDHSSDSEKEGDSDFDEKDCSEEEDASEDSESAFEEESDAESSSVKTDSEEDEGLDWDEMEKRTIEQENRQRMTNLELARA